MASYKQYYEVARSTRPLQVNTQLILMSSFVYSADYARFAKPGKKFAAPTRQPGVKEQNF